VTLSDAMAGAPKRQDVQVGPVTTRWLEQRPSGDWLPKSAPTAMLERIEVRDVGRGAWRGFGLGFIVGAIPGALFGFFASGLCSIDCSSAKGRRGSAGGSGCRRRCGRPDRSWARSCGRRLHRHRFRRVCRCSICFTIEAESARPSSVS
jgi:hypothetical protein